MTATESGEGTLPRRNPDTSFRAIGDEGGLVVLPGRAEVQVLNPVGIKVYALLDGKHTLADIAREVTAEFDVSEEEALRDAEAFIEDLRRHGMLAD